MAGKRRGKGDGSIFQIEAGVWRGYITLPMGKRKYVSGATRAEVQQKLRQLQKEAAEGRNLGQPDQPLSSWLATWLETVQRTRTERTHTIYADACKRYIIPTLGRVKLSGLKPDHIQQMLYELVDSGLSVTTAQLVKGILSTALAMAVKRGLVGRNVATLCDVPKTDTPFTGRALTVAEVRRFFEGNEGHRLLPLFHLCFALGLRRGEALALTWANVDYTARTLTIAVSKTGKRVAPLTEALIALLKAQRITVTEMRLRAAQWEENDLLFPTRTGRQLAGSNVLEVFKAMLSRAELPDTFRFHDIRHTAISLMQEAGVPLPTIMAIVGHKQMSTTMRYTHSTPDAERAAVQRLEALFGA